MKGSEIEKIIRKKAIHRSIMTIKFRDLARNGGPDRLLISRDGRMMFMEFKGADEPLSAQQRQYIADLRAHNVDVHVVRSVETGMQLLGELEMGTRK